MTITETRPYDAAVYLQTEEDCALYLQAVIDEADGDAAMIVTALGEIARAIDSERHRNTSIANG